jgi:hypothetical protein
MASKNWPRQDVKEIEKTENWFRMHLDFVEDLVRNTDSKVQKWNRNYAEYNGLISPKSTKYLTETYGKKNRGNYIDYRVGKNKIDILHGEWLQTPLKSTVKTINSKAVVNKLRVKHINLGAAYMKKDLVKLAENGIDPMEGAPIQDPKDPEFEQKITPKDKNEIIMQRIIDTCIDEMKLVQEFGRNFVDGCITGHAGIKINVNEDTGDIWTETIDPRDGIFIEFDNDPLMKKSFVFGSRRKLPINEILMKYKLSDKQRSVLDGMRDRYEQYLNNDLYRGKYSMHKGQFAVEVLHLEWMGVRPKYTKKSPLTNSQKEFAPIENEVVELPLQETAYERNMEQYKKRGEEVTVEWEEVLYEATRIGHELNINMRPKPFMMRDEDSGKPMFSYVFVGVKSVDGECVSLQEVIEPFSNIHNIVMYQSLREISKMKGKSIAYDRAGLPKGKKVKDVLYNLLNDSFIDYSSSGQANMGGRDLPFERVFKEIDLGLSNSFQQLLAFKNDNLAMMDRVTGINEYREGNIAASATATNAAASQAASRTITESLFFYMHAFVEEALTRLAETAKLAWGLHKPEKLRFILGDEDFEYLKASMDIANQSYGVSLVNGRREQMLKQKIEAYAESYANKGEMRFVDLIDVQMSDTLADARKAALEGWDKVEKMKQMSLNKQLAADQENSARQSETAIQLSRENREDVQMHELQKIREKGKVDLIVKSADAKNQAALRSLDNDLENGMPQ